MIPITLTKQGRVIGQAELFDLHEAWPELTWTVLTMCFDNIRTITRTNDEWRVDLEEEKME